MKVFTTILDFYLQFNNSLCKIRHCTSWSWQLKVAVMKPAPLVSSAASQQHLLLLLFSSCLEVALLLRCGTGPPYPELLHPPQMAPGGTCLLPEKSCGDTEPVHLLCLATSCQLCTGSDPGQRCLFQHWPSQGASTLPGRSPSSKPGPATL